MRPPLSSVQPHWNAQATKERTWRVRAIIFAALAIVLAWQVTSRSLVSYLAEVAPEVALYLRPDDPVALLNLADRTLGLQQAERQEAAGSVGSGRGDEAQTLEGEETRSTGSAKPAVERPSEPIQSPSTGLPSLPTEGMRERAELALI